MTVRLEDLYEEWTDASMTPVDRKPDEELTEAQRVWREEGVVILPGFMADLPAIDNYITEWLDANGGAQFDLPDVWGRYKSPKGWADCTPYMRHAVLRSLCCWRPLALKLQEIIGEPMGVHLNLSGWVSTQRDWHSDQYLNEPFVGGFYAAVWMALGNVHPDSGPFQWVPRSHLWPPLSQERVLASLEEDERGPRWPAHSERLLTPLFEERIRNEGHEVKTFLAAKGDVLVWHGRLVHRGSVPNDPTLERRALISHYSGINHRPDFPKAARYPGAGWFFPIMGSGPVF